METLKFSVIIPLYNKEKYIARALKSVVKQSFAAEEIIVVDDGSNDASARVVRQFEGSKIKLIQQENCGVSAARNRGIIESSTKMIAFLDADDEWKPNFLEEIGKLASIFPEAGAYSTNYEICTGDKIIPVIFKFIPSGSTEVIVPNFFKTCLYSNPPICSSSVCIKKEVFKKTGYFNVGSVTGEDIDMWIRIAMKFKIAFSWEKCCIYYRNIPNNACKNYKAKKNYPFVITVKNAIEEGDVSQEDILFLREFVAKKQIAAVKENLYVKNKKVAKQILKQCNTRSYLFEKNLLRLIVIFPNFIIQILFRIKQAFKNN